MVMKIIAQAGTKQVGALTSGESGILMTVEMATGISIPPMFVFPRVRLSPYFFKMLFTNR